MKQEIRKRLNQYIADEGVTAKFIAKKLNIHESVLWLILDLSDTQ